MNEIMNTLLIAKKSDMNILELPRELINKILHTTFNLGYSINAFVMSCRHLYYNYRHLLYTTKAVYVEEHKHFMKSIIKGQQKDSKSLLLLDLLRANDDLLSSIYLFTIHSSISTSLIKKANSYEINQFIPIHLPKMNNLIVLNVIINCVDLILDLFKSLPASLKVLVVRFEFTKFQLTMTSLKTLGDKQYISSYCPNIQYFQVVSQNMDLTFGHLHPEFSKFRYSYTVPEEITFENNLSRPSMKLIEKQKSKTHTFKVKCSLSLAIYSFMERNSSTIIKMEILGIDINILFNQRLLNQLPIEFSKLRMLSFDNTSRTNMNKWFSEFQKKNSKRTFLEMFPLLVCHDRSGRRLYHKRTNVIKNTENNAVSELEFWNYGTDICSSYLELNKEMHLEY